MAQSGEAEPEQAGGGGPPSGGERALPDCGDLDMRIAADGSWYHQGGRIGRTQLVKLFAGVLRREEDGSHWLVTPVERCRVAVEDAPFLAVEALAEGEGQARRLRLRTNIDQWIEVGDAHPLRIGQAHDGQLRLYAAVERGLEAALARPVWYQILDLALADSETAANEAATSRGGQGEAIGLWAGGRWFDLSPLAGAPD
ncbi:DUF1285 domain-containing protein [Geminicoccus roseus]|uniref:DUF1285 domain-containing protein n=1 Tax=Geminicoccus roseus TaxID=404900 RepID=UPI0004132D0D|nr:DUF1285 domain-containing protein [Geminicoccus roseus]